MINLNRNKVVKTCQRVRKVTNRRSFFSLCAEQEQERPGLLFRADGALLTDDRKKAKAAEQAASILSTKYY